MTSQAKILVVDDNPTNLGLRRHVLEAAGYGTQGVENNENVFQVARRYLPDLILLCTSLLDPTGFEICRQIKADNQLHNIFVILLSGIDNSNFKFETGVDDFITEPISEKELLAHVQAALRIRTAEEALRLSEQRYQQLIDQTVDGIFLSAPGGKFIFANSKTCEMLGYAEQELLQLNILDTYPPNLVNVEKQRLENLQAGESLRFERPILRKDGSEFPIETTIAVLNNGTFQSTIRDITERNLSEQALRESEDKFKYIFDHSVIGKSIILVSGGINANQVFCEMLGYSHEELQAKKWDEIIHPNDLELTRTEINSLLSGQRESTSFIKRYLHKNGSTIWVEEGVTLRLDAQGEPLYFLISANNITARREAELALVASNSYLQAVLDSVNDAVFVYGDNGQIIDANHSMCEIYGYTRFETLHTSIANLGQGQTPYSQADMVEWLRKSRDVGPQMFEWLAKHKDGHLFWAEVSIRFAVIDGENRFVFVVRDISEHKQAEDDLHRRTQEAERLRYASAALTSSLELDKVLDNLLSHLSRAISCDSVSVFLHEPGHLLGVAALGIPEPERVIGQIFPEGDVFFQRINKTHQPIIMEDIQENPDFGKWGEADYVRGWMGVPLIVHDETIGLLTVDSRTPGAYNEANANLALAFANHAAAAIENARLFEETRRRVAELEVLYENSLTIGQLHNPRRIAQIMAENLSQKLKWHHAAVRLYHPETDSIELLALHHPDADSESLLREIEHLQYTIQTSKEGLSGWVIQHGEVVYNEEVSTDPRYVETYPGIRSGVYVPMKLGAVTLGCVSVESAEPAAFDKQDLRLLSTIASQTAIAIHQAQLYERVQQYASELEQRVEERTADLRHANLELANASRMKDEFLASMSHELRTPLTSVLGLSEALQMQTYGALNEKQLKSLKTIEGSGRHLLDLINDILDLSKIEAGKLDLQFEPCIAADICQASLSLVKGMAQQKKQNINFNMNLVSLTVRADSRRLKQMLVNLLSNAVKFTPEGGSLGLDVQAIKAEKLVRFSVWDKGIGIAPEEMGKLFRPFTQLDSRLARQYSGTGLGLSLVQRMAELHGGSVEIESVLGEGSRFTIHLPWTPDVTQPVPDLKKPNTGSLKNAMVIEDNDVDAENAARYLQALGIKNISQPTIRGALEKAAFLHPSAILLDLIMPDGSGLDLLSKLKADERTCDIPVIIASVAEQRAEAMELGALGYLVKPYNQQDLHSELDKAATFSRAAHQVMVIAPSQVAPLVMIADDNEQILEMVSDFLEAKGYRVIPTRSGFELLDRAPAHHPDLILVDIQMPGMDGLETMRHLRSHRDSVLASTPIIAITALAMPGDYEKCLKAGANEYMSKPIALAKLLERVKEFLKAKSQ